MGYIYGCNPFKVDNPFARILFLLQGLSEINRCVVCIRNGQWPARPDDVEEDDVEDLQATFQEERSSEEKSK